MIAFRVHQFVPRSYGDGDYFVGGGNDSSLWYGSIGESDGNGDGWEIYKFGYQCPTSYEPLVDELNLAVFLKQQKERLK
jgi:hypothetical protein